MYIRTGRCGNHQTRFTSSPLPSVAHDQLKEAAGMLMEVERNEIGKLFSTYGRSHSTTVVPAMQRVVEETSQTPHVLNGTYKHWLEQFSETIQDELDDPSEVELYALAATVPSKETFANIGLSEDKWETFDLVRTSEGATNENEKYESLAGDIGSVHLIRSLVTGVPTTDIDTDGEFSLALIGKNVYRNRGGMEYEEAFAYIEGFDGNETVDDEIEYWSSDETGYEDAIIYTANGLRFMLENNLAYP